MEHLLAFALTGFAIIVGVSMVFFAVWYIRREMYSVHDENISIKEYKDRATANNLNMVRERSYTIP